MIERGIKDGGYQKKKIIIMRNYLFFIKNRKEEN